MFTKYLREDFDERDLDIFLMESELEFTNIENAMILVEAELNIKGAYAKATDNITALNETIVLMEEEKKGFWKTIKDWLKRVKDWFVSLFTKVKETTISKVELDAKWVSDNTKNIQSGLDKYNKLSSDGKKKYDDMTAFKSTYIEGVNSIGSAILDGISAIKSDKLEDSHTSKLTQDIKDFNDAKQEKESDVFKVTVEKGLRHFASNGVSKFKSMVDDVEREFLVSHRELEKTITAENADGMNKVKASKKRVDSFLSKSLAFRQSTTLALNSNYMSFLKAASSINKPSSPTPKEEDNSKDEKDK